MTFAEAIESLRNRMTFHRLRREAWPATRMLQVKKRSTGEFTESGGAKGTTRWSPLFRDFLVDDWQIVELPRRGVR